MVYFFNNNDQHDLFELPPRALHYEDFQNYYGDQPAQKSGLSTRPNRSEHIPSTASTSNLQWLSNEVSSLDSFPANTGISPISYPTSQTSQSIYASQSDFYRAPNVSSQATHPPPVPTEIDYSFLANVDPTLLNADILNSLAMSGSVSYTPESAGNSSLLRKRPLSTGPDNALFDAFSSRKRRRIVNDNSKSLPISDVYYPANAYNNYNNNLTTNHPNDLLALPVSTSRPNATPLSSSYPNPQNSYDASYSLPALPAMTYNTTGGTQSSPAASYRTLVNDTTWWDPNAQLNPPTPNFLPAPSTIVVPTAAYSSGIQLSSDDYPEYDEGTANNTLDLGLSADENGDLFNGTSSLPYSTSPPDLENAPFYWSTDVPGRDNFYNTTSIASVASGSNVVPSSATNPAHEEVIHTNVVVNNTTFSSVIDLHQHSSPTHKIPTTGNDANATIPNVSVPSTSGAPNVDPLAITYEITAPSPPSSSTPSAIPKKKRSRKFESKPAVDQWMWYYKDDLFHCRYTGPDRPKGCAYCEAGPPQVFKTDSIRNFERHIRRHAKAEASMQDLSQHERVAMNALAASGKLRVPARCDLEDENLVHCDYYRQNGRRWAAMTMERAENLERKHRKKYHDVGWKEKRPPQPRPQPRPPPCPQSSKKQSKRRKA